MKRDRMTLTVPEAGRCLGLGRNASYAAAQRGELPVIRIGGRLFVPIAAMDKMLAAAWQPPKEAAEP